MADSVTDTGLWYGYDVNAEKTETGGVNATTRKPNDSLDKDAFLKLMLTQMQYQDPLNPTDDKQFLAQMAQFTSLEQMQNMSKSFAHTQAYTMIGKAVYAEIFNEKSGMYEEVTGVVTAVKVQNGEAMLMVGEKEVPVNKVMYVFSDNLAEGISNLSANIVTSQNMALIGKFIQAVTVNEKGEATGFVEGEVDNIKFDKNGTPVLVVGNEEVYAREVISVAGEMRLIGKNISAAITKEDGQKETIFGEIDGVNIIKGNAYLSIGGKDVLIKNIGLVTDALKYTNQTVKYDGVSGVVSGVIIRGGVPFLQLKDSSEEINFATFKGVKIEDDSVQEVEDEE